MQALYFETGIGYCYQKKGYLETFLYEQSFLTQRNG